MDTIPKYDQLVDLYNRMSDFTLTDSRSYYFYSSVPEKLRDQWSWKWKIQVKGSKAAPHIFIDGLNIEVSPSAKTPAIEINNQATAYLYFVGRDSTLQGATGRAAIQKNRSEGTLYVPARTGTTVTCKGDAKAAGIGGSYEGRGSEIYIYGGNVIATGVEGGAGIGGGRWMHGKNITVTDAHLKLSAGRLDNA